MVGGRGEGVGGCRGGGVGGCGWRVGRMQFCGGGGDGGHAAAMGTARRRRYAPSPNPTIPPSRLLSANLPPQEGRGSP